MSYFATSVSYLNKCREHLYVFFFGQNTFTASPSKHTSFRVTIKPVCFDTSLKRSIECIESLKKQKPVTREEALAQVKRNEEMLANDPMYKSMR